MKFSKKEKHIQKKKFLTYCPYDAYSIFNGFSNVQTKK